MEIYLDNIGIVKDSNIEIDGITIITGHNNSGKTTVGKTIYALYSAVEQLEENANLDRRVFIYSGVMNVVSGIFPMHINKSGYNYGNKISVRISEWREKNAALNTFDEIEFCDEIIDILKTMDNCEIDQIYGMFKEKIRTPMGDRIVSLRENDEIKKDIDRIERFKSLLSEDEDHSRYADRKIVRCLQNEFFDQITPIKYRDRTGTIIIREGERTVFDVKIRKNEAVNQSHLYNAFANSEVDNVLMIDDASVLDGFAENHFRHPGGNLWKSSIDADDYYQAISADDHSLRLATKMMSSDSVYEEMKNEECANEIIALIDEAFNEEIIVSGNKLVCSETKLDVRNLAAGSKLFAIIRQLLLRGQLTDKTLMILDEPDDHLHPAWQLILAKVLYLLNSEIGVKILLTTHSTNLVYAFEINMIRDGRKVFRIYDTYKGMDDYYVRYINATDNLNSIYQKLGEPFIELRRAEYSNDNI